MPKEEDPSEGSVVKAGQALGGGGKRSAQGWVIGLGGYGWAFEWMRRGTINLR